MAEIKRLQAYARKLREAGFSEAEIRRSVDRLEADLDARSQSEAERAPEGTTPYQLAQLNLDRAVEGKAPLLPAAEEAGEPRDLKRDLSDRRIAEINLERAHDGLGPLTSDEMVKESIRRATAGNDELPAYAPKGLHPKRLASIA